MLGDTSLLPLLAKLPCTSVYAQDYYYKNDKGN
ncbi:hypothetical protein An01g11850 [Aspergillus niger]|uniref:Uncharacterized protein n=2 Tax=Aspergillus niger TaxID=5061 RepID=A2QAK6_ASPNC|nr:hypothetical protein An01g11850 [Aspergillus niger]CAK44087.1 hypothetical protein An01g11850 [Aspergillus niger]